MEKKFKIGDVVFLNSGGPEMTVHSYIPSRGLTTFGAFNGKVRCNWFHNGELKSEIFDQDCLGKY